MTKTFTRFATCIAIALAPVCAMAGDEPDDADYAETADEEYSDELTEEDIEYFIATDTIEGISGGMASIGQGNHVMIDVPASLRLIDAIDAQRLLEFYWANSEDSLVLGALVPAADTLMDDVTIAYILYYNEEGYISDDDAAEIDYDELLKQLQESAIDANEVRREMGLPEHELVGWAKDPTYDAENKVLRWAQHLRVSYDDNSDDALNYDVRILGRYGFVTVLAVADMADADAVIAMGDDLSQRITFSEGYRYADFNPATDEVSDWTIGGLVAGTALLAKTGILAKIGLFLVKAWKLIAVAVVAIGGVVAKFFGKKKKEENDVEKKDE